jgi:glycosyltransferase involved in cell wall biosynthesis
VIPHKPSAAATDATILLATLNGARWIERQLHSIESQDWQGNIHVLVSDDGSTDGTLAQLDAWRSRWTRGAFTIEEGPRDGHAANFRRLVLRAPAGHGLYAYSDQDDIWMPRKLSMADAELRARSGPALTCGSTLLIDESDRVIGRSIRFSRPPSFRNALVQSIAGGNTMVLNAMAFELVRQGFERTSFVSHDWFSYMLVSGAGGAVIYSDDPSVAYRQHDCNAVGANTSFGARVSRIGRLMNGSFRRWNDKNLAALQCCRSILSANARETLDLFAQARDGAPVARLLNLRDSGCYRQTHAGQVSLYLGCLLRKI